MMMRPGAGAIDRRHVVLVWGAGMVLLGLVVAFLLAKGEIRTVTLLLLAVLGLLCLSPRRGIYILLAFLPFMYFLRRQILYFNEFSSRDPILLFPPLVTIGMFFGFILFYTDRLYRYFTRSALIKAVLGLLVVFLTQMFNPLQGGILVGIAGGMYFVIPMLWVFIGLLIEERDVRKILGMVILIGTVVALYGLYQHYFGFTEVERYELESKRFFKAFGERPRIMSTFAGLGDFSMYLVVAGFLCFAQFWRTKRNFLALALLALMSFTLLWVAVRTSFLLLAFSIVAFLIVYSRRPGLIIFRGVIALIIVGALYAYLYTYSSTEIYDSHGSTDPFVAHTVGGLAHPTRESTFRLRLETWSNILKVTFTAYPLGHGLGSTTTAATKFSESGRYFEADSFFFELIYGSSPVAAILFVVIIVSFIRATLLLVLRLKDNLTYKTVFGLLSAYMLGSFFGSALRDTISGPLAWLLIGWTVKEFVDRSEGIPAGPPVEELAVWRA